MIKTFVHPVNGKNIDFCATLGDGSDGVRAMISTAASPETLVILEVTGPLSALKVRLESPEALLDDAIRKAQDDGLIEQALKTGQIATGSL